MTDLRPTWLLLCRQVSDDVPTRGAKKTFITMVLDAATGLVVATHVGTAQASTIERTLRDALIRPAPPVPKVSPARIVCAPELLDLVSASAANLTKLADSSVIEGIAMWDAEEVFDGLVGHLQGRSQPDDPPSVGDQRALYSALEAFAEASPWRRWSDDHYFQLRLTLDDDTVERVGVVLGAAGVQRGFNVIEDTDALHRAADNPKAPLRHLEQSLIVHLSSRREASTHFVAKACRDEWSDAAAFFPEILTVRASQPADLSRDDARLLTLAVRGVVVQDARRLVAVGDATVTDEITFEDGVVGRFEVGRP